MPGAAHYSVEVQPPADGSTRARVGRLELTHGVVETPQFMPVGTNATVKALDPDEIAATGATIILANTYHLYLRPGHQRIERFHAVELARHHRAQRHGTADSEEQSGAQQPHRLAHHQLHHTA